MPELPEIETDPFTAQEHLELDKKVARLSLPEPPTDEDYASLLSHIIIHANDKLDPKYTRLKEAENLIKILPALRGRLESAFKDKSFRTIRVLDVLNRGGIVKNNVPVIGPIEAGWLLSALKAPLKGASVKGLYDYLRINNATYTRSTSPKYYGKFCSIVQSSGTGKTRLMLELGKVPGVDVVLLYMNLRPVEDQAGYPSRDLVPATILAEKIQSPMGERDYRIRCRLFFAAIFDVVAERLKNGVTDILRKGLCEMDSEIRRDFFEALKETYLNKMKETVPDDLRVTDQQLSCALKKLEKSYNRMCSMFAYRVSDSGRNEPKLVIALDEAHSLYTVDGDKFHRPLEVFRTISEYSDSNPVWVLFTSTASRVSHFASPNKGFPSDRVRIKGQLLFQPFSQTGWDIYAPKCKEIEYEEVAITKNIIGYGRPLWYSQFGDFDTRTIFDLAKHKLCGASDFVPSLEGHALAVLGQRFALEISFGRQDATTYVESAVESFLRICITTTPDRTWTYTTYPSEPFLSCAAASLLHGSDKSLETSLTRLQNKIENGMIEVGGRGEVVSRLLWLIAKDLFVLQQSDEIKKKFIEGPENPDSVLVGCDLISVVEFLKFVFGANFWNNVDGDHAEKEFEGAYINFSHWALMDANIQQMKKKEVKPNQASLEEFTERHWKRTSAVQCCHNQPHIDKVIPMYFKGSGLVSQIFISDKDRMQSANNVKLQEFERDKIASADTPDSPPFILILADLGAQRPRLKTVFRPRTDGLTPRLIIHAYGMDPNVTYPFLKNRDPIFGMLHALVRKHIIPNPGPTYYSEFLQGQAQFSSSTELRHVRWEDWSETNPERTIEDYRLGQGVSTNIPRSEGDPEEMQGISTNIPGPAPKSNDGMDVSG